jgi:hypothetical protein
LAPAIPAKATFDLLSSSDRRWGRETKPCTLRPNTSFGRPCLSRHDGQNNRVASVAEAKHHSPSVIADRQNGA